MSKKIKTDILGSGLSTDFATREKRRKAVRRIITELTAIRIAEEGYLEKVPENFQTCDSYETGELAVGALDEIVDMLEDVY